jgi:PadR family transcriptional regulator PadR
MSRSSISPALVHVLHALVNGSQYGFDVIDATGLPSGTVYPALSRLERDGLVDSQWEDHRIAQREKRPARRYYQVTAAGKRALRAGIQALADAERAHRARAGLLRPLRVRG